VSTAVAQTPAATAEIAPDRWNRGTPRGTVAGFVSAVDRADFPRAAQFLETAAVGEALEELATHLAFVIDHGGVKRVSDLPEGSRQEGLPPNIERLATVTGLDGPVQLELVRVTRDGAAVWIFSADTLRDVPRAYEYLSAASINRKLPAFLIRSMWLSVPLWKYLALLAGAAGAFSLARALRPQVRSALQRWSPDYPAPGTDLQIDRIVTPLTLLLWLILTVGVAVLSDLPYRARQTWYSIVSKVAVAIFAWLLLAAVARGATIYSRHAQRTGRPHVTALIRTAQRIVQALCLFFAILFVLKLAGFDVSTMLAGLGVGALAVTFGAQKLLENVFGGVSVVLDQSIRVGDECQIAGRQGRVMDIGIRSTRFRTDERTVLTVPNGQLAGMILDNLTMRDMFLFRHNLGIGMEPGGGRLEELLAAIARLLASDPQVDSFRRRVRLTRLEAQSVEILVSAYLRAADMNEFLSMQEALLLKIVRILDAHGAVLSAPVRNIAIAEGSSGDTGDTASPPPLPRSGT